jgi:hypothetical protein
MDLSNFKILNISLNTDYNKYLCYFCNKECIRIARFDNCEHYGCTVCVDNLYDFYKNDDKNDAMFLCTICNKTVYNITYN